MDTPEPHRPPSDAGVPDAHRFLDTLHASWKAQALHAAAVLGIADILAEGPCASAEVAARCAAPPRPVHQLLRALSTIEVCTPLPGERFALGRLGVFLRTDHPESLRTWTLWWGEHLWGPWGVLTQSVRTGRSGRALLNATRGFDHLADPGIAALFHRAVAELTALAADAVVRAFDFSRFPTITDVGGGQGELLAAILVANPGAHAMLLELPAALALAEAHLTRRGVVERCSFVEGDFFRAVPPGSSAYLLKSVLHDWDDADCVRVLERCREAMTPDARLIIVEQVMPDTPGVNRADQALARSDLMMLVAHGAGERTAAEYRALLHAAGFQSLGLTPAGVAFSVIEASICP